MTKKQFGQPDIVAMIRIDQTKYERPIIAIKESALTPDLLMATISALAGARERSARKANQPMEIRFLAKNRVLPAKNESLGWARGVIASLRAQPERHIAVTGKARELVIPVPVTQ